MIQTDPIYLDHNATTRPDSFVITELMAQLQSGPWAWGNPSSIHLQSRDPKNILRETRRQFASIMNCAPTEIIFNSGASEGNNTVLKSVWQSLGSTKKNEFLISTVEHPSVIKAAEYIQEQGAIIKWIPVDREGVIDLGFIQNNISEKTALISVMFANNETGHIFPIQDISSIAKANNILFHVDCVQALGKEVIDLHKMNVHYATFSAHKFYALKGCGILFVKKGSPYINLIHGGGQERGRRGGTENVLSIWSLQQVLRKLDLVSNYKSQMQKLRDLFEDEITKNISEVYVTGSKTPRLANTSSLIIHDVDGETLLVSLDLKGFAVSTGAACSSGNPEPSPVLLSMGLSREEAQSSLRVSLGWNTTEEEIHLFVNTLTETVHRLRKLHQDTKNQEAENQKAIDQEENDRDKLNV
jgi:cysteine desulfurase